VNIRFRASSRVFQHGLSCFPQPTEVMYNGDVHYGAERTTHIRSVHGIVERASAIVYARDVVRAYLPTTRTPQVLLCRGAL